MANKKLKVQCGCNAVELALLGSPKVHAHCHCNDCRELLNAPFSPLTAWEDRFVEITKGEDFLMEFQHPQKQMKRVFCSECGETLFYTNSLGWRIVPQLLIKKCLGLLPDEFKSDKHIFYEQRVTDIDDNLPKHLQGSNSPLCFNAQ